MVSGMQARGPPTWSSFYERIFNIDDVPMQKYGSADTYADRNSGTALAQSKYAMNGQGYGIKISRTCGLLLGECRTIPLERQCLSRLSLSWRR